MIVKINLFFNFKIIAMRGRRLLLYALLGGGWYINTFLCVFVALLPSLKIFAVLLY